jgi:uroporphyrinogen decarboxylase
MKHIDRMKACIAGDDVDRLPVALWRHFPVDDMKAETMAQAHLSFQAQYDFDLVKVTPPSGYFLYDWGLKDRWQGNMEGTRTYTNRVIDSPDDWEKLPDLDPSHGYLGEYLEALRIIRRELGPDTPMVMTFFNILALTGYSLLFSMQAMILYRWMNIRSSAKYMTLMCWALLQTCG